MYQYVQVVPYSRGDKPWVWYKFPVDREDKNGFDYRSRTSLNAFFHSSKSRNYAPNLNTNNWDTLYHASDEYVFNYLVTKTPTKQNLIELDSIYEFFKVIGYNYKTRKYERQECV